MIFKKRKPIIATLPSQPENKPDHAKPADTKPADAKPARNKRTGAGESASWTNRMQDLLESARQFDRQSIPNLVDILFETPIPVNSPSISDGEVSALLNYPGRSPAIEVESVTAATEYQTWIRECNAIVSSLRDVLNGFPNCILQGELLDLAIAAAGYDLNIQKSGDTHDHLPGNIAHINVFVGTKNSIAAVNQLCTMVTPVTSNLLHKVAQKKKIQLKTGSCTHFSLETIWFGTECEAAATALAARGNPLYDPEAYFTH
jgi:flagellar biosynthesis/type III secretory pathway ATPase